MTQRMTIEEARARGYLPMPQNTDTTANPKPKNQCPACNRTAALLLLIRRLLEDGHDLRLEHRFHPKRRWRFDVALMDRRIALEIDGGGWVRGAHHRKQGRDNDNEKDAEAQMRGWIVLRVSWDHVKDGQALALIRRTVEEAA